MSNTDINLSDLNIVLRSHTSIDLLKSGTINLSQIEKSINTGSIFKRKNKIIIGRPAPIIAEPLMLSQLPRKCRSKNTVINVKENIDDFVTEEDPLAADLSDSAELDRKPNFKK